MKPSRFTYHAPHSVDEALDVLGRAPDDTKVLAGGQSLFPILNFRLASPDHLVDINRVAGLETIERLDGGWRIPALARQRAVERHPELRVRVPLLTDALAQVAHVQIRNRGTVCGSLAHGDSSAELPSVMVALDARMTVASADGVRTVPAEDFFVFHMTTAVAADELLLAVEFDDLPHRTVASFQEFALRKGDFGLAGVAARVTLDDDGTVLESRVVAAGVAPVPQRLTSVEQLITGTRLAPAALAAAQNAAYRAVDPTGDIHADAAYRRQLAAVLLRRALADVAAQAARTPEGDGLDR